MMSIKVMCFAAFLALTNNALASSEVNTESLSYDALLSSYQYDSLQRQIYIYTGFFFSRDSDQRKFLFKK